jgi:NADH-quinone oxidoreductase subunit N
MSGNDLLAVLPLLVLGVAVVIVMLAVAVRRNHALIATLTGAGLILSYMAIPIAAGFSPRTVTPLLVIDGYALFYMGLMFLASLAVTMLSYAYLKDRDVRREEYYILLLISVLGSAVLVSSSHFASFFLGLELLSIPLFALIAYPLKGEITLEAAIKYLVIAGVSTAFLLFGMALIYGQLGTMDFLAMGRKLVGASMGLNVYWLVGFVFVVTGIGFKLALVPFHMWTPDVYEGAPSPVVAYVATVSKGAMAALLLRYFAEAGAYRYDSLFIVMSIIAVASMLGGNILALLQNNVKRILAYSSIAHLGYLVVALLALGNLSIEAVSVYLVFYFVTLLGAFGVVGLLSSPDRERDADNLEDYRGLFWRHPWMAASFSATLFSLAGIPLTIGFIGKFYVVLAAVNSSLWILIGVLVLGSAIGLYYYLRVVVTMFMTPAEAKSPAPAPPVSTTAGHAILSVLVAMLVGFGVYPATLIHFIRITTLGLF